MRLTSKSAPVQQQLPYLFGLFCVPTNILRIAIRVTGTNKERIEKTFGTVRMNGHCMRRKGLGKWLFGIDCGDIFQEKTQIGDF